MLVHYQVNETATVHEIIAKVDSAADISNIPEAMKSSILVQKTRGSGHFFVVAGYQK